MGAPEVSRRRAGPTAAAVLSLTMILLLVSACGAPARSPAPSPTASSDASPSATAAPSGSPVPPDGVSLSVFGVENGPEEFSLPRSAVLESVVDQPNNVVLVLSAPPPREVSAYLQRALPGAGFTIDESDPDGSTFTFEGHGWRGSFTTGDGVCAVLLRPR